ncbi:hypothetical protein RGUI_1936 [Rhodovulum sp. P5]|uniref:hypothetical protein n=1 Tax=Rhodovulum sp. P5 TaxID=1564506 RepID=UPI0009C3697D|nr:hypothetical protein [Rhodovulum sp. P5]ARE40077.1 hypothetical protein RGUI_1936 [Rhodovulum sp. P5]
MRHPAALLAAALLLTACVPAPKSDAPRAIHTPTRGNLVVPDATIPGQFEVFAGPGDGPGDFWCAAAEYAERQLRALPNRRLYVVKPRGRSDADPRRTSVVFTIQPDADLQEAAQTPRGDDLSMQVDRVGSNFSMAHGRISCRPVFQWPWDG